jgi:hypothetical protein
MVKWHVRLTIPPHVISCLVCFVYCCDNNQVVLESDVERNNLMKREKELLAQQEVCDFMCV